MVKLKAFSEETKTCINEISTTQNNSFFKNKVYKTRIIYKIIKKKEIFSDINPLNGSIIITIIVTT